MKISEILHKAADEYLWDGSGYGEDPYHRDTPNVEHTCGAVFWVEGAEWEIKDRTHEGLKEMGVPHYHAFDEFKRGPDRQYARYVWLKFAAHIAEEQGV